MNFFSSKFRYFSCISWMGWTKKFEQKKPNFMIRQSTSGREFSNTKLIYTKQEFNQSEPKSAEIGLWFFFWQYPLRLFLSMHMEMQFLLHSFIPGECGGNYENADMLITSCQERRDYNIFQIIRRFNPAFSRAAVSIAMQCTQWMQNGHNSTLIERRVIYLA